MKDIWTLEKYARDDLNHIIDEAFRFRGVSERAYLRRLWGGKKWPRIKAKLIAEGYPWYTWYMDGVRQHLRNIS